MSAKSRKNWQIANRERYNLYMRKYNKQRRKLRIDKKRRAAIELTLDSLWSAHRLRAIGVTLHGKDIQ